MVARPGGFSYLVYVSNSWHARFGVRAHHATAEPANTGEPLPRLARADAAFHGLSRSLHRALQPPAPAPARRLRLVEAEGPFARYRWLARRRRWWQF